MSPHAVPTLHVPWGGGPAAPRSSVSGAGDLAVEQEGRPGSYKVSLEDVWVLPAAQDFTPSMMSQSTDEWKAVDGWLGGRMVVSVSGVRPGQLPFPVSSLFSSVKWTRSPSSPRAHGQTPRDVGECGAVRLGEQIESRVAHRGPDTAEPPHPLVLWLQCARAKLLCLSGPQFPSLYMLTPPLGLMV